MKSKSILILTLSVFIFVACNKEESTTTNNNTQTPNTNDTLVKKIIYYKGTPDEYTETYSYDGNKLIKIDAGDGDYSIYTYENNKLVNDKQYLEGILTSSTDIAYDINGKVSSIIEIHYEMSTLPKKYKTTFIHNSNGTISVGITTLDVISSYTTTGTYTFLNNNLLNTELNYISNDPNINIEFNLYDTFEYDNKNNIFKNIHQVEVFNLLSQTEYGSIIEGNSNNVIKYFSDDSEAGGGNRLITFEYTYDSNNFPKTATRTQKDNGVVNDISSIEYFY